MSEDQCQDCKFDTEIVFCSNWVTRLSSLREHRKNAQKAFFIYDSVLASMGEAMSVTG